MANNEKAMTKIQYKCHTVLAATAKVLVPCASARCVSSDNIKHHKAVSKVHWLQQLLRGQMCIHKVNLTPHFQ